MYLLACLPISRQHTKNIERQGGVKEVYHILDLSLSVRGLYDGYNRLLSTNSEVLDKSTKKYLNEIGLCDTVYFKQNQMVNANKGDVIFLENVKMVVPKKDISFDGDSFLDEVWKARYLPARTRAHLISFSFLQMAVKTAIYSIGGFNRW